MSGCNKSGTLVVFYSDIKDVQRHLPPPNKNTNQQQTQTKTDKDLGI